MCLRFSIIRWYANHIFLNANHPGWPPRPPDHPNHPDHLDPLTTRATKTSLTTLVSPTLNSNLQNLQTYCLVFANKFSVTTICKKKKVRSDILQKNCLEQELAKKVFQTTNLQKRCPEQPDQPDKFAFLPDYIGVLVSNPVLSALLVIQSHNQQPLFSSSWRKWNQSGRKKREGVCTNWF